VPYDVDRKPGEFIAQVAAQRSRLVYLAFAAFGCALFGAGLVWYLGYRLMSVALYAVFLAFAYIANEWITLYFRARKGEVAEISVGEELNMLRYENYIVMHDLMFGGEGNLDHLVSGPNGVFLVETKFGGYKLPQLTKLKRQAARVHDALGRHYVTPIMCSRKRDKAPYKHRGVWIAGRGQVAELIRRIEEKPVDPERLFRFADRLS
jgi:hypothetical protein